MYGRDLFHMLACMAVKAIPHLLAELHQYSTGICGCSFVDYGPNLRLVQEEVLKMKEPDIQIRNQDMPNSTNGQV